MNLLTLKSAFSVRPFSLGRIANTPIRLSWSWLVIFALHSWALSTLYLPNEARGCTPLEYWIAGLGSTLVLFASVLAHELAHALMARFEGLGIEHITLHIFGGMTKLENEAPTPAADMKIAVVGPATSFLAGFALVSFSQLAHALHAHILFVHSLRYLGVINLVLATFNLLPGFPLDGGRLLKAYLWWKRGSAAAATRLTVRAGKKIALALIFTGTIYAISTRELLVGLWTVLVGVFLMEASASMSEQFTSDDPLLARLPEVIDPGPGVAPDLSLARFIDEVVAKDRQTAYVVTENRKMLGVVSLADLKSIPSDQWDFISIRKALKPVDKSLFITVRASLGEASRVLSNNGLCVAGVIDDDGTFVGTIRLERLRKILDARSA